MNDSTNQPGDITRRSLFTGALAAALWGSLSGRGAALGLDGGWELPAGDLRASRSTLWPVRTLDERWRLTASGGVTGSTLVLGNAVVIASMGGEVICANLADGTERWRRDLGTAAYAGADGARELGFFAGPAAAAGRIVVASDRVFCLDARSGTMLWTTAPLRTAASDDYFWGGTVIAGGLVLAGSGSGGETPTARGRLTAYDLRTGALRWSVAMVDAGETGGGILAPVSVDLLRGSAYVCTGAPYAEEGEPVAGASSLVELALADGSVRFRDQLPVEDQLGMDLNSAPLLLGRLVCATAKNGVWAWDRVARRRLWHRQLTPASGAAGEPAGPTDGPEGGPLATDGLRLFALSNDGAAGSYVAAALDPQTGDVLWRQDLPAYAFAAPAVAGDTLFTASAAGTLHALRTRDGALLGEAELGDPSAGAVSSARGRVLVGLGAAPYLPGEQLVCLGG